jgi:arginine deiminase
LFTAPTWLTRDSHPNNCHELLFDDVIWLRRAQERFDAFVDVMRGRGVEVLLFHDLLTETLGRDDARTWVLERRLRSRGGNDAVLARDDRVDARMAAEDLATCLSAGVMVQELPEDIVKASGGR